jgi:hypothetical protein
VPWIIYEGMGLRHVAALPDPVGTLVLCGVQQRLDAECDTRPAFLFQHISSGTRLHDRELVLEVGVGSTEIREADQSHASNSPWSSEGMDARTARLDEEVLARLRREPLSSRTPRLAIMSSETVPRGCSHRELGC